jgi:iron complex transport system permease protein
MAADVIDPGTAQAQPAIAHPRRAVRLCVALLVASVLLGVLGLAAGGDGWSLRWAEDGVLVTQIRAPRTLGAWVAGALLGLAGALAQGLFRNPLADPYLLGSAAGAGLAVVLLLVAVPMLGAADAVGLLPQLGMFGAAFAGALAGVALTLALAGGGARPTLMLLCGVVVAVLLTAASDLLVVTFPEALRGRTLFSLGTTAFVGWTGLGLLAAALALTLPAALRLAGVLDALVLGERSAASLGLDLSRLRLLLVAVLALATGAAVAQVGLVSFVGLVSPHLVRRWAVVRHGPLLLLSALAGGVLLLAADLAARLLIAPRELPVGVLTALVGGMYLLVLLRRRRVSA